jgi:hypothetical protein
VDPAARSIRLSMILKWYQRDFAPPSSAASSPSQERAMLHTILPWLPQRVRAQLEGWLVDGGQVKVEYAPYDWGVNKSK